MRKKIIAIAFVAVATATDAVAQNVCMTVPEVAGCLGGPNQPLRLSQGGSGGGLGDLVVSGTLSVACADFTVCPANSTVTINMSGYSGLSFATTSFGNLSGTIVFEATASTNPNSDPSLAQWALTPALGSPGGGWATSCTCSGASGCGGCTSFIYVPSGPYQMRVRARTVASGSETVQLRATVASGNLSPGLAGNTTGVLQMTTAMGYLPTGSSVPRAVSGDSAGGLFMASNPQGFLSMVQRDPIATTNRNVQGHFGACTAAITGNAGAAQNLLGIQAVSGTNVFVTRVRAVVAAGATSQIWLSRPSTAISAGSAVPAISTRVGITSNATVLSGPTATAGTSPYGLVLATAGDKDVISPVGQAMNMVLRGSAPDALLVSTNAASSGGSFITCVEWDEASSGL